MKDNTFNEQCAKSQIEAANLTYSSIQDCMGDSDADQEHTLLQVSSLWLHVVYIQLLSGSRQQAPALCLYEITIWTASAWCSMGDPISYVTSCQ